MGRTIALLILSNAFMTLAWYGHLRYKDKPLWMAIVVSWAIAFFEYCLQVPANRWGHMFLSAPQLKTLQEGITFAVFSVFSVLYLREKPTLYDGVAFLLVLAGVAVGVFQPRQSGL